MSALPPVVFDLDGTLIDSVPDLAAAVNRTLAAEGQPAMPVAEVQSYVGDGAPELVRKVMAARGLDPARHADLTRRIVSDYTANSANLTRVYPGVRAALGALRSAGHALGICTNKPFDATVHVLQALDLEQFFDVVIGGDTLPRRKPDPAPLHAAFRPLGGSGLFVGDSEVDAATAAAADVPFFLFTKGYLRAARSSIRVTEAFDDFSRLPELVRTRAGKE